MCTRLCCSVRWGCVVLFCVLHRCCSVLCAAYCSVLCILYLCMCVSCICSVCVHIVCILCACVCVRYRLRLCSTQSDTPHVGYLCGYMVRIIKYKKTQPLIKLKSIWFSKFLLCFKIMLLLSEKVSIKWNVLPDNINRLQPKKTSKNGDIFDLIFLKLLNYFKCVKFRFIFVFIFLCNFQERFSYIFEELVIRFDVLFSL